MSPPKRTASGSSRTSISQKLPVPFKKSGDFASPSPGDHRSSIQKKSSSSKDMTVGISDEGLVNMDIKDLNDYLRRLPKDAANLARRRRRLLKNRGYAQSTRTKRLTTIEEASERQTELRNEIGTLKQEIERLRGKRDQLRMTRARMERAQAAPTSNHSAGGSTILKQGLLKTEGFGSVR